MKVYLGKPKFYFGPYQLAEKLMFWVPKERDEFGFPTTADKVHDFGEWLSYGSLRDRSKPQPFGNVERGQTWLAKFLNWIDSKRKQRINIRIDPWDTWDMSSTLAPIILTMLRQLKDQKSGVPYVEDVDVPEHLQDENLHDERWDYIFGEMLYAFEQISRDWEAPFFSGESEFISVPTEFDVDGNPTTYALKKGENHTFEIDSEGLKKERDRIRNGLMLFGKYYQSLWS